MTAPDSTHRWDVFVSHSSKDKSVVGAIVEDLRQSGLKVWYDASSIHLGARLRHAINEGVKKSATVVIVISVRSLRSAWVLNELDSAMLREISENRSIVVPVLIGRIAIDQLPQDLQGKRFLDLRFNFDKTYRSKRSELIERVTLTSHSMGEAFVSRPENNLAAHAVIFGEHLSRFRPSAVLAFAVRSLHMAVDRFDEFTGPEVGPLPDVVRDSLRLATEQPIDMPAISEVIERAKKAAVCVTASKHSPNRHIDSIYDDTNPAEDALYDAADDITKAAVNVAEAVAAVSRGRNPAELCGEAVRRSLDAASHCCDAVSRSRYVEKEHAERAVASFGRFVRSVNGDLNVLKRTARR